MTTIGFIYPDHAAEDDYPLAEQLLGGSDGDISLPVAHIYGTDLHAVPELLDLGSETRLAEGARLLAKHQPEAVVWACTSGSFVYGWDGARNQADQLAKAAGVPASSTSFAFVHAAKALGVQRVAVAASYPDDVARLFVDFLAAGGVEVLSMSSADIDTAAEVGQLAPEAVVDLAVSHDHPDADAVLVPDTAMRTLGEITDIEAKLGKPVLTANQVTVWEGLRLTGASRLVRSLGALFRTRG
ncbi:maleate cis-trans isomerase [Amycolatopsis rubida]|uniref:Maleate cis-trans isomerase n=1 Tax=Amycolatopsis rubida TaxID=112413 RepID=A0A1I5IXD7_9PSEU|nr:MULTISPECIES: aspartate/glutamate racemase family protein [Amycolatopsis]MYW91286.1 maleate cis-trans isomerase [Amycolatopsis rubida]NEC56271.1 maleate cis-trans isomerase [Amycolatopsis rubida]OAP28863.1 Arylmalonate decarboxylase [Amycolatopsis sp. M39]SFO65142.1 Maleate cis-trans isomerase [Amycolatopsis rubida]